MTTLQVEQLEFTFDQGVDPFQYERGGARISGWPNHRKVVDVVVNEPPGAPQLVWLIEAKDFRVITNPPKPANLAGLAQTVSDKVVGTLGALPTVVAATQDVAARAHATAATTAAAQKRVVLHLEPHPTTGQHTKLFPAGFSASVLQKLRQLVRTVDANPLVLNIARTPAAGVPWVVA